MNGKSVIDNSTIPNIAVAPRNNCPHVQSALSSQWQVDHPAMVTAACKVCGNVGENWRCLTCQGVFCSRFVEKHMLAHAEETSHAACLSFSDLSSWCYKCDDYIVDPCMNEIKAAFYVAKFGEEPPSGSLVIAERKEYEYSNGQPGSSGAGGSSSRNT